MQMESVVVCQDMVRTKSFDLKQVFNAVYFSGSAAVTCLLSQSFCCPPILVVAAAFFALTVGSLLAVPQRKTFFSTDFELPKFLQILFRASALLIPVAICAMYAACLLADAKLAEGNNFYNRGDYGTAIRSFKEAVALNPHSTKSYVMLCNSHIHVNEDQKAIDNADKALELDPMNSTALGVRAWALNRMGRRAEAMAAALKAVELAPYEGSSHHVMAKVCYDAGQYKAALSACDMLIQFHRYEVEAFELRADVLFKLGQNEEAKLDRNTAAELRWLNGYAPPER